jgi:ethanolamine utilization protein EutQ (cupin superfamily)
MQHENCQEQEDGSFMCDGMPHANCEKVEDMDKHYDEEDMGKHDDEEDMNKHDDEEKMSGHDDEEDMGKHDEEDMNKHDDEEDMDMHDDEEEEEEMKKFMRSPIDEIEANVMKQFRKAIGDNMQIVQWSMFDDMIAFYNGNDGKYYRVDFVMNDETETLTFGKPVIVMKRYLTEQEINQLFPEQQDRGGQVQNATKSIANGKNTPKQKGVLLTESQAKQFKKDMAELQVFRKADKLKLAATFQELVDKEIYNSILESIDSLTKEQLETKLSVEAMKRIKAEKESQKTQTINPVKFYTGATNTHTNQNPVASLIDQWKDKK